MEDKYHQRGSVLVISLFILLALAFFAGMLTLLVLNTIRSTTNYSLAQRSSYAAESGLEQGLFYLHQARVSKNVGVEETVAKIGALSITEADPNNFSSDAEYFVEATSGINTVQTTLADGESVTLDFFDEDYSAGYSVIPIANLSTIFVGWNESPSCSTPGSSKIEVSFSSWLPSYWQDLSDPAFQTKYAVTCPPGTIFQCEYNGLGVDDLHIYSVKIKALECDLDNVEISAYDLASMRLPTHNEVMISSTGELGSTKKTINAKSLWRTPLNDYFDYVLFSDEDLVK